MLNYPTDYVDSTVRESKLMRFLHTLLMVGTLAMFVGVNVEAQVMGSVAGQITDDAGMPISCGVLVIEGPNAFRAATTTDANGNYALPDLEPGSYTIEVHTPGAALPASKAPPRVGGSFEIPSTGGGEENVNVNFSDINFQLPDGFRRIFGFVFAGAAQTPVPVCEMFARTADCELLDVTFTCQDGSYELILPESLTEDISVSFQLPGFEPVPFTIPVEVGQVTQAPDIILPTFAPELGSILGVVLDDQGVDPIVRAEVTVTSAKGMTPLVTNCSGAFHAQGLPVGEYDLVATAPGFGSDEATVTIVDPGERVSAELFLAAQAPTCGSLSASGDANLGSMRLGDALVLIMATACMAATGLHRKRRREGAIASSVGL